MTEAFPTLFSPIKLGPLTLRNRIAMAPLTRQMAEADGTPVRIAGVTQDDIDRALKLRLQGQTPVAGGLLHLNAAFDHMKDHRRRAHRQL